MQTYATKSYSVGYKIKDNVRFLDTSLREYRFTVKDLPRESQPREKLMLHGPESLTIRELLAVILNTGTTKENVLEMSERLIRDYGEKSIFSIIDINQFSRETGLPETKSCQIIACGEIGRRLYSAQVSGFTVIRNAQDVFDYLQDMKNLPKEHLRGLYLNNHNKIIRDEVISIGTVSSSMIHPREVFRPAIECNAVAVVLAHNHPSGEPSPSDEDILVTKQLIDAGKMLGINILDHVIITKDSFASIKADY
jgi:DNA repair protein RadC